jgi:hypothetical protein
MDGGGSSAVSEQRAARRPAPCICCSAVRQYCGPLVTPPWLLDAEVFEATYKRIWVGAVLLYNCTNFNVFLSRRAPLDDWSALATSVRGDAKAMLRSLATCGGGGGGGSALRACRRRARRGVSGAAGGAHGCAGGGGGGARRQNLWG